MYPPMDYDPQQQGAYPQTMQQPYYDPYQGTQQMQMPEIPQEPPQRQKPTPPPKRPRYRKRHPVLRTVLILLVLAGGGWFAYTNLLPRAAQFDYVREGTLGTRYAGDCLIVRNETPFDAEGVTRIQYKAEEGSEVAMGTSVCEVYSTSLNIRELNTLQDYRDQIRDYQLTLIAGETAYDAQMARLENDLLAYAKEAREIIGGARGSLTIQEKRLSTAIDARQAYLRNKFSSDQRMTRLYDDEKSQSQRITSWTKGWSATFPGIISFYSDGYEYGLTTENAADFSPTEVRRMFAGQRPEKSTIAKGRTTIFRIVRDEPWKVLFLVKDTTWNPVNGQTYDLKLEGFDNAVVSAQVESFTRTGGELLVRLSVDSSVKPFIYLRSCRAEVGDYVTGFCVNSRAITRLDGMEGIAVPNGEQDTFIPVNIIWRNGEDVYVTPVQPGALFAGQMIRLQ